MSTDQNLGRFVASVSSTIPSSYEINKDHRCYLPVSLETKPFQKPRLEAVRDWIAENFSHCVVLVGDNVHRLTLQITKNLSPDEAEKEARMMGERFIKENQALFENKMAGVEFLKCSTIEQESAAYQDLLMKMFEKDEAFRSSINQSAAAYVDRRFKRFKGKEQAGISMERSQMMELSCQYLIEEMALFATVVKMGWTVDVYPGEDLNTMVEIVEGRYPDVPEPLIRRKSVALKLEYIAQPKPSGASAASASTFHRQASLKSNN